MTFSEHARTVMDLASGYLKNRDLGAVNELENLLPVTEGFLEVNQSPEVLSLLALNHCILALYHVESTFNPAAAKYHALASENFFHAYLTGGYFSLEERRKTEVWKNTMTYVRAYCAYCEDDFEAVPHILSHLPVDMDNLALAGAALTRMAFEKDPTYAYPAFSALSHMDQLLRDSDSFDWIYKEDIYRTAYGFLTLLYADGQTSFPDEPRMPRDLSKALACSKKIYNILTDPQQKAWAMEDVENYTKRQ